MKHLTKIIMVLFFGILWSQENPTIMRGGYDKILKGKDQAFQKNVAAHVKKWHGADQWNQYGWRVETGPRTGQYLIGTFNHYWKDFDDRVTSKEHNKDWARITNSYIDDNNKYAGSLFWNLLPELSYNSQPSPKISVTFYYCKDNAFEAMLGILGKLKQANEKAKIDRSYNVYKKEAGGPNDVIAFVSQINGYRDMAPLSPSLKDRYVAAFGETVWQADYATWTNGVKWSETEILTLIPEISTPSTE